MNLNLLKKAAADDFAVGNQFITPNGNLSKVVAGPHPHTGEFVLDLGGEDGFYIWGYDSEDFYLPPLTWVEGEPVYPGDVLYWRPEHKQVVVQCVDPFVPDALRSTTEAYYLIENLTWTKPKTKLEAWVNIYPGSNAFHHPTRVEADEKASLDRRACIKIEWEE